MAGLGAAQFAHRRVDLLRDARDERDENVTVAVSATDPANPFGVLIPGPMSAQSDTRGATRTAGARVVMVMAAPRPGSAARSQLVCASRTMSPSARASAARWRASSSRLRIALRRAARMLIEEINGKPAIDDTSSHF